MSVLPQNMSALRPLLPALCRGVIGAALLIICTQIVGVAEDLQAKRLQFLQNQYEQRRAKFAQEMGQLADYCESQSFFTDAEQIRKRAQPVESGAFDVDALPEELVPPLPLTLPDDQREWRAKQQKLEHDYAIDIYKIARDALKYGYPSVTYTLVREVAFHDPNNVSARSMLGFVQDKNRWTTPFARRMAVKNFVDDPQFGWIESRNLVRYQNGERLFDGKWISKEKEEALRADFNNAWEIGSEHFVIRTNYSLEKGVELSRKLEEFHDFFLKEYAAFFNSRQQMEKLLEVGTRANWNPESRYRVNYYRNKNEFVAALKQRQPGIEIANGLYLPHDRTAYFYNEDQTGDEAPASAKRAETMYHEVTHQLLGESRSTVVDVGERSDFWVIEGFACYMESFTPDRVGKQVGDPRHDRIHYARLKVLEENAYQPMRQFTALGRPAFPLKPEAYNQSAAMVHFFLNYEEGAYRDAFIQYLSQVYNPADRLRLKSLTLEQLTGVQFETLDAQFLEYLRSLPSDPPAGVQVLQIEK
ncbi:hypothetical protein [Planctomicrobium piriforme]|uniref:hypothetical protein n=1 Tax=Planctomicrobium piriforme TaxID=1576369 RepID=UPI001113D5AB|nr:hypothetical protein [Planctomicrobium piriforme]